MCIACLRLADRLAEGDGPDYRSSFYSAGWDPGGSAGPQAYLEGSDRGGVSPNVKPSFTVDQAATQLLRHGFAWSPTGQPTAVTYAYAASSPNNPSAPGWSAFSAAQIAAAELALLSWSDVAGITFQRVDPTGSGYADDANMRFNNYTVNAPFGSAFAYYPGDRAPSALSGDVYVNSIRPWNTVPQIYDRGFLVLVHEIGHAIGLAHPGAYDGGAGSVTYENAAEYYEDSPQYTVMTYFSESATGGSFGGRWAPGPQLDDIAAAQRLYGPNMSTRTGDTVYGFNATADRPWFSAATAASPLVFAVWDAGGNDTFDFSGYAQNQKIDLRQGYFSDVGGLVGNVAVAMGVTIESAKGGSGADAITGNEVTNFLFGAGGADTMDGGANGDFMLGGAGADRMLGGAGVDLLGGEDGSDFLTGGAEGDNIYGGAGLDLLFGEAGLDFLSGQDGDDVIGGNGGWDVMHGGAGADRFLIFSTADSDRFNADIILDFTSGVDKLDVGFIDANSEQAGDQAFVYVGFSQTATGTGTLRIGFIEGVGIYLYGHVDGDDLPDLMINIGTFAIGANDFIL